jgi:DNA-binding NtrC family response regulator
MAETKEKPLKILIVDDDESVRNVLQDYFANQGFQTFSASNNDDALECLKKENIDIVTTDINHYGAGDGLELTRTVKAICNANVIILSGNIPDFPTPEECFDAGASAAIKKPAKLDYILDTIEGILQKGDNKDRA